MKAKTAKQLGFVTQEELDEQAVDIGSIVTDQCFHNPINQVTNYRTRAVDKLLKMNVMFQSNGNITNELFQRLFQAKCPKCKKVLKTVSRCGGNAHTLTIGYTCPKCKWDFGVTLQAEGGLYVAPKKPQGEAD